MTYYSEFSLSQVLSTRSITTCFHPIVSLRDRRIIGLEALSRGVNPENGHRIPPFHLFSQAAKLGKSLELDRLCRKQALSSFMDRILPELDSLLWLNFETSVIDRTESRTGHLLQQVADSGLPPHRVVIEIIESKVIDSNALAEFVDMYKSHGFLIAIDDFGAGYSNLERIAQIKPDIIKIDRSLINDIDREYHKQEVVRSLRNLAVGVGSLVVAEGIETEEEALTVMSMGINLHQGFHYAFPDQPLTEQISSTRNRLATVSERYREERISQYNVRKEFYRVLGNRVQDFVAGLSTLTPESFSGRLAVTALTDDRVECLYLLNEKGFQFGPTHCNPNKLLRPDSPLFRPAPDGADLSLKDYYLLVKAGLPRYVSDPYISRASGNLCVTLSQGFTASNGEWFVLCADYDCSEMDNCC